MFQHPAALWGLLALAIPILVHLLNFRPPKRVLFSQLAFVKSVSQVVVQRMRLKRLLLLALRLLAILAIVLAFAGPQWGTSEAAALPKRGLRVVVIDNSRSMMEASRDGSLLEQALEAAEVYLTALSPTEEVLLLPLTALDERQSPLSAKAALEQLPRIAYGETSASLRTLLTTVTEYLAAENRSAADIWLFSDFQRTTLLADSLAALADSSLRIQFVPIGSNSAPQPNRFASNLRLTAPLLEAGSPAALAYTLHNTGESAATGVEVRVTVGGKTVATTAVDISAKDSLHESLSFRVPGVGWQSGALTVADPVTGFDNTRAFALHIPAQSRLLYVTGRTESRYLTALLNQVGGRFAITTVSEDRLAGTELDRYDVILLAGVAALAGSLQERLSRWVSGGGGLVVFAGEGLDVGAYNRFYGAMGVAVWDAPVQFDPLAAVRIADSEHPLFQGVFDLADPRATFDAPRMSRLLGYRALPGRIQSTILRTESREAVLHEARVGDGAVYTHTWFPALTWGDFPVKSAFVPVVYRSLLLAAGAYEPPLAYSLAANTGVTLETDQAELIRLQRTDGFELIPDQTAFPGGVTLRTRRSGLQPGAYKALQADSLRQWVAFHTPVAESFPDRPTADQLRQWLDAQPSASQYRVVDAPPAQLQAALATEAGSGGAWRWWLVFALLCLVAEVAVVRLVK